MGLTSFETRSWRQLGTAHASLCLLALCLLAAPVGHAPAAAQAATVAGIAVPPPPPAEDISDTYWGIQVPDPYRRLEDVKDPKVQAWMRAQADATKAILGKIPGRRAIAETIARIADAAGGTTSAVVRCDTGRLFFLRRNPGENQFKLVWRDGPEGTDHVVFDPEAGGSEGAPLAVMDFSPSPDGTRLAYSVQRGGSEIGELHVVDVASGRSLVAPIDRVRYADARWLEDGSGLFYGRLREDFERVPVTQRLANRTTHFLSLRDDGASRPVFSPSFNPDLALSAFAWAYVMPIRGTPLAAAIVTRGMGGTNQLLFVADLEALLAGKAKWRRLADDADGIRQVAWAGGWFYLLSAKGAPNFQVLRLPVTATDLSRAEVVVAAGEHPIRRIAVARDALYFTRREGVNTALFRLTSERDAKSERVELPIVGDVVFRHAHPRFDGVLVNVSGWTRAGGVYQVEVGGRGVRALALAKAGPGDAPADIEAREVMVRSHDGTLVPVSIIARKGIKLDGRNPTVVYGYGGYGSTDDPWFDPRVYVWTQHGGVWATVHARGGGVFGDAWRQAGHKATKPNTWKDAIAAAEWLVREGWTSPATMGILGASAGGILVGRAITERPDLFATATPVAGVMDTVRFETTAHGRFNVPELGSVTVEEEFRALLAMSSYHAVRDGVRYPAVMAMVGANDIRVDLWQSTKFVARLSTATSSSKPVLLRVDYESGHGQGSTRKQMAERTADNFSFMLWQFGVPEFQPR